MSELSFIRPDDYFLVTDPREIAPGDILQLKNDVRDGEDRVLKVKGREEASTPCTYCGDCKSIILDTDDDFPNLCLTKCIPEGRLKVARQDYVTVTHGMRGFFAVYLKWNQEEGGFYEPWNTGSLSFKSSKEASSDAKAWADAEEVEYRS